jgi:hypothetical protein
MKKITLIMAFIGLFVIQSTAQYINAIGEKTPTPPISNQKISKAQVNCNNNGIAITVTGSTTATYSAPNSTLVCNTPVVAFSGLGSWDGGSSTGFVRYTFSQAITCATVTYSAVNGGADIGKITVNGGGTVSLSNACGASISGNTLTCNLNSYGNVTVKVSSTSPFTTITLTNTGGSSGWVQGNPCNFILNNCEIPPQENPGCCPGKNLICNGTFEETIKQCFESQYRPYSQQRTFAPGEYFITDYKDAAKLCKQWSSLTQPPCSKTGKGMFVNGATNGTGSKIIWQQKINFNGWAQYRFCMDLTPLTQCCFNVTPKLEIKLTYQSGGQTKTVLLNQTTTENCGIKYAQTIAQWEGSDGGTATISITLDETGIGDGNDFILDNITLIELQPIPKSITNSSSVTAGANLTINGNFTGILPAGASCGWFITPLDANGQPDANCPSGPLSWWSPNTNFQGFVGCGLSGSLPGKLLPGKSYKVHFATAGTCFAWDAATFTVTVNPASMKMIIKKEEKTEINNDPVIKSLRMKTDPPLSVPTTSGGTIPRPK